MSSPSHPHAHGPAGNPSGDPSDDGNGPPDRRISRLASGLDAGPRGSGEPHTRRAAQRRCRPQPKLSVVAIVDVLDALIRCGLPDGQRGVAALLCNHLDDLIAVMLFDGGDLDDAPAALARTILLRDDPVIDTIATVWFVELCEDGEPLDLSATFVSSCDDASALLSIAGIELGEPIAVGPHGWHC
jgi:hypothetical protein